MSKKAVNATNYEAIPPEVEREHGDIHVFAVIETPKNSRHKYALNNDYGIIAFHEIMPDSMEWPYDYGFIPQTLAPDGDPLDILVITEHGLFPGCLIEVRLIGAVMESKDGTNNHRTLAVPLPSAGAPALTDKVHEAHELPEPMLDQILTFLRRYSELQGHQIDQRGVVNAAEAMDVLKRARKAYKKQH